MFDCIVCNGADVVGVDAGGCPVCVEHRDGCPDGNHLVAILARLVVVEMTENGGN